MDVRVGGRGGTAREVLTGRTSSSVSASLVIGSVPFCWM
jgi:hypothetical protein